MNDSKKIAGGRVRLDKKENREEKDNYPTPICATKSLMEVETFQGEILEPACGEGKISKYISSLGYDITSSDIRPPEEVYGAGNMDFFKEFSEENQYDNIITNPPYDIAKEFIKHCHVVAKHKIALLLRLALLESENRFNDLWAFDEYKPHKVYIFVKRLPYYKNGEWHITGGQFTHAWFVWDKNVVVDAPKIHWLMPDVSLI